MTARPPSSDAAVPTSNPAHRPSPGMPQPVSTYRLQVRPDRLEGRLSDGGQEYPGGPWGTDMPDPMDEDGRGLALATAVLDSLSYERDAGVNHWTMVRELETTG